jgi:iron complex transport system ATP-binding protein
MMELEVRHLFCGYPGKPIVKDVSLTVRSGELWCLLGPNGVGKTTLFKSILGLLPILGGSILLNGEDVRTWSQRSFARKLGYVAQAHTPPFPFTVIDVVTMGRAAHIGAFASPSAHDIDIAEEVLSAMGLWYLRNATYTQISGGERQLVLIARALAQQPEFLFMDEPTSNLDYGNQVKVLTHILTLTRDQGLGVVMTTHNPNDALLYGSRVAVMGAGGRFITGAPHQIITKELLDGLYGVLVQMIPISGNANLCVPVHDTRS